MIVAVVDKFPVLRSGLKLFLNDLITDLTIIESRGTESLYRDHPSVKIDLIILGVSQSAMPRTGNIALIRQAKKWYPSAHLVVYDEVPEPDMVLIYMEAGMHGYISKQAEMPELMDCIREVMRGKKYVSQEVLNLVLKGRRFPNEIVKKNMLTARELEIAQYLCEGMGTNWIAEMLNLSPSTVSTFKAHIFKKLGIENIIKLRDEMDRRGLLVDCALN